MEQEAVSSRMFLWTCFAVLQDDSYTFFETDSEEEEPQEGSEAEIIDRQPKPRTAFQVSFLCLGLELTLVKWTHSVG